MPFSILLVLLFFFFFFFFNDTATTELYTLSLHDALPISADPTSNVATPSPYRRSSGRWTTKPRVRRDRKSTRLNSSHRCISYAVFCLKKKKTSHARVRFKKKKTNHTKHN